MVHRPVGLKIVKTKSNDGSNYFDYPVFHDNANRWTDPCGVSRFTQFKIF